MCLIFKLIFFTSVTYFLVLVRLQRSLWSSWWVSFFHSIVHQTSHGAFFFIPSAHYCYATRMYYAPTSPCLLIWNPVLWFDKQLHGFSTLRWWERKILLTCRLHGFFSKWNLEMSLNRCRANGGFHLMNWTNGNRYTQYKTENTKEIFSF